MAIGGWSDSVALGSVVGAACGALMEFMIAPSMRETEITGRGVASHVPPASEQVNRLRQGSFGEIPRDTSGDRCAGRAQRCAVALQIVALPGAHDGRHWFR